MIGDEGRGPIPGHDEDIGFVGTSNAHVTIRIEDFVVMEDMVCGYESVELEHQEFLFRLWF
jgi:hypothetical protein